MGLLKLAPTLTQTPINLANILQCRVIKSLVETVGGWEDLTWRGGGPGNIASNVTSSMNRKWYHMHHCSDALVFGRKLWQKLLLYRFFFSNTSVAWMLPAWLHYFLCTQEVTSVVISCLAFVFLLESSPTGQLISGRGQGLFVGDPCFHRKGADKPIAVPS